MTSDAQPRPLIQDSMLARWVLGIAGTLGTLALGWGMSTLNTVNQTTLRVDTQVSSLQSWSYNIEEQLIGISERVDTVYLELEAAATAAREQIEHLDDRVRRVELELAARREVIERMRRDQAEREAQVREQLERRNE